MTDNFGVCSIQELDHGPFEARPKPRKDADLAAIDGDPTPVPGGCGLQFQPGRQALLRKHGGDEATTSVLGGYSGTGQRPCQPAKED